MHVTTTSLITGLAVLTVLTRAQECEHVRFTEETKNTIASVLFEDEFYNVNFECADPNYVVRLVWTMPLDNAGTESQWKWPRWDRSALTWPVVADGN